MNEKVKLRSYASPISYLSFHKGTACKQREKVKAEKNRGSKQLLGNLSDSDGFLERISIPARME